MIKISSGIDLNQVEGLYINLFLTRNMEVNVKLPRKLKHADWGLVAALLQFISTWRRIAAGDLHIELKNDIEYEEFIEGPLGYAVVGLCRDRKIYNNELVDITEVLERVCISYHAKMNSLVAIKASLLALHCFDKKGSTANLLNVFYDNGKFVKSETELDWRIFNGIKELSIRHNRKLFNNSIRPIYPSLIAIIYELYLNTHEWARTNEHNEPLYPNVRSVFFKLHIRTLDGYREMYGDQPGVVDFFTSKFHLNSKKELYLLEISILDSGPGLVKRKSKVSDLSSISIVDELEVIKECLTQHCTSAQGEREMVKGRGLDKVLQTLSRKGFLMIRTGRLHVYRNLRSHPHIEVNHSNEIQLFDWISNDDENFSQLSQAEGTLITALYPIDYIN